MSAREREIHHLGTCTVFLAEIWLPLGFRGRSFQWWCLYCKIFLHLRPKTEIQCRSAQWNRFRNFTK